MRAIVIALCFALACRSEKAATRVGDTAGGTSAMRVDAQLIAKSAGFSGFGDSAKIPAVPRETTRTTDSASGPIDTAGVSSTQVETPRIPTPEELRDSALAFARREPGCAKAAPDSEAKYFHGARPSREFFPDSFCFGLGGSIYTVTSTGAGFRLSPGSEPYPFTIAVDTGFDMSFLAYRMIGRRLYFLYEITDSEVGAGLLEPLDVSTLQPSWKGPARVSFNVGDPLITDSVAYMTGINQVGKVRLSDGKFIWKHVFDGIHQQLPGMLFNAFDTPVLENGLVRFGADRSTSQAPDLLVDERTGVVVSPDLIKGQKPACTGDQPFC
ncbi:MAG TPA: hypothetical protein VF105_09310 [Gemmatimonadaceae bacterium]